jgi:hypothetical protein
MLCGCAARQLVPVGVPDSPGLEVAHRGPLRVVVHADENVDPLPLRGGSLALTGVRESLSQVVAAAAADWARRHASDRPGGWTLRLDLLESRAEASSDRVTVELAARATLSASVGPIALGQTHAWCWQEAGTGAEEAASCVQACMESMARDLAGWLGGVPP